MFDNDRFVEMCSGWVVGVSETGREVWYIGGGRAGWFTQDHQSRLQLGK